MEIRRALIEDALAVFEWRNDPESVAVSKTGAVEIDGHMKWFATAIESPDHDVFIATEDGRRIGTVRFDKAHDRWVVSINLAPSERNKGYSRQALDKAMAEVGPRLFRAEIKSDNLKSIHLFQRCGFRQIGSENGWLHFERA